MNEKLTPCEKKQRLLWLESLFLHICAFAMLAGLACGIFSFICSRALPTLMGCLFYIGFFSGLAAAFVGFDITELERNGT
jgi:hypothetical protein